MFGFGHGSIQFATLPQKLEMGAGSAEKRALVAAVYEIAQAGRNLRAEAGIATNQKVKFAFRSNNTDIATEQTTLGRLLNASEFVIDPNFEAPHGIPVAMTRSGELFLLVEVDRGAERGRLDKEIAKMEADLRATESKLASTSFVDRAPAAVVDEHRERQKKFSEQLAKLKQARGNL